MTVLGTVTRLQVQRSRLKPGPRGARSYTVEPLLEVDALLVEPRGVRGVTADGLVLDVHHADHPDTRHRGGNGLSLMPRPHYDALRARYGPRLADGVAGENILLETDRPWREPDLTAPLHLETVDGGLLPLADVAALAPCVEFTRWVLGRTDVETDDEVLAALDVLDRGARGFGARALGTGRVERGARLLQGR